MREVPSELYEDLLGNAVEIAKEQNITLDYSSESVTKVDDILESLYQEYKISGNMDGLDGVAMEFGAYIVETIRRNSGERGVLYFDHETWGVASFPFSWKEQVLFPYGWCLKRIQNGNEDNVYLKYQNLVLPHL